MRHKKDDEILLYSDLEQEILQREKGTSIDAASTEQLQAELQTRAERVPIMQLAQRIIQLGKVQGMHISPDRLICLVHRDVLDRPEVSIGYNLSRLSLPEILEENDRIRQVERIAWSALFAIYKPGRIRLYAGDGNPRDLEGAVTRFVEQIARSNR